MKKFIAVLMLFMVAAWATNASAATVYWYGTVDNNWENGLNWSTTPNLPGAAADCMISGSGANKAILAANSSFSIDDLYVGRNTAGELDITGGNHTFTNRFRTVYGATTPDSILNISGTTTISVPNSYSTWGCEATTGDSDITISNSASVTVDRLTLGQGWDSGYSVCSSGTTTLILEDSASLTLTLTDTTPASSGGVLRMGETTGGVYVTLNDSSVVTTECLTLGWFDDYGVRTNTNSPGLFKINDSAELHLTGSTLAAYGDSLGGGYEDMEDFPEILLYKDTNGDDFGGRLEMNGGVFDLDGDETARIEDMLRSYGDGTDLSDAYLTTSVSGKGLVGKYDSGNDKTNVFLCAPGDANGDGYCDVSDLGILAGNYGQTGDRIWMDGNFSQGSDWDVDVTDLGILAGVYGTQVGVYPTAAAAAVPEPSTLCLLAVGALALVWRRRK